MSVKINPLWKQHNDFYNEGGEGFNPQKKWIPASSPAAASPKKATSESAPQDMRLVKDLSGNLVRAHVMAAQLAADEQRLARLTDPSARRITQQYIDHARAALAQ